MEKKIFYRNFVVLVAVVAVIAVSCVRIYSNKAESNNVPISKTVEGSVKQMNAEIDYNYEQKIYAAEKKYGCSTVTFFMKSGEVIEKALIKDSELENPEIKKFTIINPDTGKSAKMSKWGYTILEPIEKSEVEVMHIGKGGLIEKSIYFKEKVTGKGV